MVFIQFYVEEPSAEAFLRSLLPKILPAHSDFDIQVFQGKSDLLANLPGRLKALSTWIPDDWRMMVLVDRDDDDCRELKARLDQAGRQAGLSLRATRPAGEPIQLLNRIAIEELEAWILGDIPALCQVYPRLSPDLANRERYRDTDAIRGGTWEALERALQKVGYHQGGLPKIAVAREVALHMTPERNRSPSFQVFYRGLKELADIP